VDITLQNVRARVHGHPRIELVEASSTSAAAHEFVQERCLQKSTMVILDSDHSEYHVREELRLYAPLVSPGNYLIVEDTNINGHPVLKEHGPGPYEAVQEFLKGQRNWVVDREREKLLLTFNPNGYLRNSGAPAPERQRSTGPNHSCASVQPVRQVL
jgi:cephalosporin hydroxylase